MQLQLNELQQRHDSPLSLELPVDSSQTDVVLLRLLPTLKMNYF